MKNIVALALGILFSIGLTVSGMVNPNKVIGFLDIFRDWDPDLMFVMGGAAGLNFILFKFVLKRNNPILSPDFQLPTSTDIDKRLIIGSAMFGVGWGIGGVCPGPGLANLFTLKMEAIVFVAFMLVGMLVFKVFNNLTNK